MTRKNRKIAKLIACAVLSALLLLSFTLPALAADDSYAKGTDSSNPARAAITKVLKMPVNTPTPVSEFEFVFTKVGVNDPLIDTQQAKDNMPGIGPVKISFAAGEEPVGGTFIVGDTKTVVKESSNFLANITAGMWLNGVGIYKYVVEERQSGIDINDATKEGAVYSEAKYNVEIWVDRDSGGVLFPKYVVVRTVTGFIDEYYEGTPGGEKVDPTPGGTGKTPVTEIEDAFSHFIFTNRYWMTDGGGTDDPDITALEIRKLVEGLGSDTTRDFIFSVMVTQSSVIPTPQTYRAYVVDAEGVNVTSTAYTTTPLVGGYIVFPSGVELTGITLKHGYKLMFFDLHIGSAVAAKEAAADGYIPSYARNFSVTGNFTGAVNTEFGFPRSQGDPGPHFTAPRSGNNTIPNIATFTNMREGATPTGISVNDLPYIVLLAVSVAGVVGFMIFRYRRNAKHDE